MKSAAAFWDARADKYSKQPIANMDAYTATLDCVRSYLSADDRVLEVGCGTGTTALLLSGGVREYVGTDVSESMIRIACEKAAMQGVANAAFKTVGVGEFEPANGPFDAVLAFNLLHLLPDLDSDLATIASLVRPSGLFISKSFCGLGSGAPFKFRLMMFALPVMQALGKAPFVQFQTEAELQQRIAAQGFEILDTRHFADDMSTPFIVARKLG